MSPLSVGGSREPPSYPAGAGRRYDRFPVVSDPVPSIRPVGEIEAINDLLHSLRTVDRGWRGIRAVRPTLEQELAQSVDVVRVKVREENTIDLALRDAHLRKDARGACANVDYVEPVSSYHRRTRARTLWIRDRRAGATECHVEPVRKLAKQVGLEIRCDHAADHSHRNLRAQHIADHGGENDHSEEADQKTLHFKRSAAG